MSVPSPISVKANEMEELKRTIDGAAKAADFEEELRVVEFLRLPVIDGRAIPAMAEAFEGVQETVDGLFDVTRTVFTHCDIIDYRSLVASLPSLCLGVRGETQDGDEMTMFFTGDFTDAVRNQIHDRMFWTKAFSGVAKASGLGVDCVFTPNAAGKAVDLPPMKDGAAVFAKFLIAMGEESWLYVVVPQRWIKDAKPAFRRSSCVACSRLEWIDGMEAWGNRYVYAGNSLGPRFWDNPAGTSFLVVIGGSYLGVHEAEHLKAGTRIPVSALHLDPVYLVHPETGEIAAEGEVLSAGNAWSFRIRKLGLPERRYLDPPEGLIGMMVGVGTVNVKARAQAGSLLSFVDGYCSRAAFSNGLTLAGRFLSDGQRGWFEVAL